MLESLYVNFWNVKINEPSHLRRNVAQRIIMNEICLGLNFFFETFWIKIEKLLIDVSKFYSCFWLKNLIYASKLQSLYLYWWPTLLVAIVITFVKFMTTVSHINFVWSNQKHCFDENGINYYFVIQTCWWLILMIILEIFQVTFVNVEQLNKIIKCLLVGARNTGELERVQ